MNQAYVYSHAGLRIDFAKGTAGQEIHLPHKYAISLAVEMNYERMRYSPGWIDNAEVGLGYLNAAKPAVSLAGYIRELGYAARAHFFINEWVLHVPIAVDAGFGELSRNGILITAPFGPRVRLATVTTDLPLVPDSPVNIGAVATCKICRKCAENCPSQALPHGGKGGRPGSGKMECGSRTLPSLLGGQPPKMERLCAVYLRMSLEPAERLAPPVGHEGGLPLPGGDQGSASIGRFDPRATPQAEGTVA